MKAVLGWLSDPYLHIIAVGLVLVRLAMGAGGGETSDPYDGLTPCVVCHASHQASKPCPKMTARIQAALHRR